MNPTSRLVAIAAGCILLSPTGTFAATQPLAAPAQLSNPTVINFDGLPHLTVANNLFQDLGVNFGRDDGQAVFIQEWTQLPRFTTSPPNVLSTITDFTTTTSFATHLNAQFTTPVFALGAYFGNDQDLSRFSFTRLSVFDFSNQLLGVVDVPVNNNTSVDQYIGLQSDVPIFGARFENFESAGLPSTVYSVVVDDFSFSIVPEPTAFALLTLGGFAISLLRSNPWP